MATSRKKLAAVGEGTSVREAGGGVRHVGERQRSAELTLVRWDGARGRAVVLDGVRRAGRSRGRRGGQIFWRRIADWLRNEAIKI